jgi:hypothetical protein
MSETNYTLGNPEATKREKCLDAVRRFQALIADPRAHIETLEVSASLGDPLVTKVAAPGAMATTWAHRYELRVILEVPPPNYKDTQ